METRKASGRGGAGRWVGVALAIAGLFFLVRTLPIERWIEDLKSWLDGFGLLGMGLFMLVYVVAVVLLVPGSALTLVAGALFGMWWGTAAVSVASTSAAAIAFLIARTSARSFVEARAKDQPRFQAIDRAIGQGGWRIVVLLRLSPAMPFSIGNYLYGLTAIRFWPYVLSSWIAMLPATFMYVYIGHIGAEGLSEASGSEATTDIGRMALLVLGLLATVIVTVYISRLAKKALGEQTEIDPTSPAGGATGPRTG